MRFINFRSTLIESFAIAQQKFAQEDNPDEVKSYLNRFKELSQKNALPPDQKDITSWIPHGWVSFKEFVDSLKDYKSGKAQRGKTAVVSDEVIKVYENQEWTIYIPLTKAASCKLGTKTTWCVSAGGEGNY